MCYNFFESLYSFAHFKCKGYILYSKLLLQWAVEKKKICPSAKVKKIISRNFQVSHWKKKYVSIIFEVKRQKKKCFIEKKMLTVNLPWNDPYININVYVYIYIYINKFILKQLFEEKILFLEVSDDEGPEKGKVVLVDFRIRYTFLVLTWCNVTSLMMYCDDVLDDVLDDVSGCPM